MSATPSTARSLGPLAEQASRLKAARADTLAEGILLLLACAALQRIVGLLRGILFCRWLSPEQLGYWDLSLNFIVLAAPLVVVGIPGTFGRYIEYYLRRGQLSVFLRRTTLASSALAVGGCLMMVLGSRGLSWLLFGDGTHQALVFVLAVGLLAVIAFNFLDSLFSGLRQMRVVSGMQFAHSLLFAGVGLGLLSFWRPTAVSVVIAYSVACLVTACGVVAFTRRVYEPDSDSLPRQEMWRKLLPFAGCVWATNVLANAFAIADRYMIVHFGGFDSETAAGMVGNYHCSRIVPMLMVSVCGLLGEVVLPHLSHDWEAGCKQRVSDRLNLMLKVLSVVLTSGGVVILAGAPCIFSWLLAGKYDSGFSVLPWTVIGCIWFSLCLVAQNYLWCAERAGTVSFLYAAGLALNIGLNVLLLPVLGLLGAVMATALAMALSLLLVYVLSSMNGMDCDLGIYIFGLLPVALCCGPLVAGLTIVAVVTVSLNTTWLLGVNQREELAREVKRHLEKLKFART